jgi:predicted HAD superfamily Cof-like phosphohydrolase
MDDTARMVAEFFHAFKMEVPDRPSVPLLSPSETGQLMNMARRMENLSRDCWHLASHIRHKPVAKMYLRLQLIQEELGELAMAMASADPVEYLDALSDLQYVLDNAYVAFGFHHLKIHAFREVHSSNMSKLTEEGKPLFDDAGRVQKSNCYRPPNLHQFVEEGTCPDEPTRESL